MQLPQPVYPTYNVELRIKSNEKIIWSADKDWLEELKKNLGTHEAKTRRKSPKHRDFARNLRQAINSINDGNQDAIIASTVLPLLTAKTGLNKKGWDGKKSYLYELCVTACRYYYVEQAKKNYAEQIRLQLETQKQNALDQKQRLLDQELTESERKDREIQRLQDEVNTRERQLQEKRSAITTLQEEKDVLQESLGAADNKQLASAEEIAKLKTQNQELIKQLKTTAEEKEDMYQMNLRNVVRYRRNTENLKVDYATLNARNTLLEDFNKIEKEKNARINALQDENKKLNETVTKLTQEKDTLQKAFQKLKNWVNDLFGLDHFGPASEPPDEAIDRGRFDLLNVQKEVIREAARTTQRNDQPDEKTFEPIMKKAEEVNKSVLNGTAPLTLSEKFNKGALTTATKSLLSNSASLMKSWGKNSPGKETKDTTKEAVEFPTAAVKNTG